MPKSANKLWNIVYYKNPINKDLPVMDFIDNLDEIAKAKVINTLDLLEEFGVRLGMPRAKKLSGMPLWELRILGKDSIRILYIATYGKTFLLLHGFIKKRQKTDKREIKIALSRLKEYKLGH